MINRQFDECCGIEIVGDFGGLYGETDGAGRPYDEVHFQKIQNFIEQLILKRPERGMLLATTNAKQIKTAQLLEKMGFVALVKNFHNPNTNHRVTLWGLLLKQPSSILSEKALITAIEDESPILEAVETVTA